MTGAVIQTSGVAATGFCAVATATLRNEIRLRVLALGRQTMASEIVVTPTLLATARFEDGLWFAEINECQGVWASGLTRDEALERVTGVLSDWLFLKETDGDDDMPPYQWTFSGTGPTGPPFDETKWPPAGRASTQSIHNPRAGTGPTGETDDG